MRFILNGEMIAWSGGRDCLDEEDQHGGLFC